MNKGSTESDDSPVAGLVERMMVKRGIGIIAVLCCSLFGTSLHGSDAEDPRYVSFGHPLVINYGNPSLGRLRYLKVELQFRVEGGEAAEQVEYHLPALRHSLVMLFSKQIQQKVSLPEGKEDIRQEALEAVQKLMVSEEGEKTIQDLLFTNFVVQR
jgi:flagellar FliL protein